MDERAWLTARFEENRPHLRAVAYRMLGSLSDADDAVQESWLRLNRVDAAEIENLQAWLTTVVARVSLNMLRSGGRREEPAGTRSSFRDLPADGESDPEEEAVLADSVGLALLVVLDQLSPAERLSFVLHDMFAVPFDEIAPMIDRTPAAARQLASRARRRVQGTSSVSRAELDEQRAVVDAFLAAARCGDFERLLAVLDPDVVFTADATAIAAGAGAGAVRGAEAVARGASSFPARARLSRPALVNGSVGLVMAPKGKLVAVLALTVAGGRITALEVIADPARLHTLDFAVLEP